MLSDNEAWHEYQDNGCAPIPDFAQRFVQAHLVHDLGTFGDQLVFMPIPGIMRMSGLISLACGLGQHGLLLNVGSMAEPGYPVPKTWSDYLRIEHSPFKTDSANAFRPNLAHHDEGLHPGYLHQAMFNFPNNPTGQIATPGYWREVCGYCVRKGIRLFNDGAYLALHHRDDCCALAEVASEFPELSWLEAYSASKAIGNGTGWRVGAVVGSADFVGDLRTIKGNTDSGPFAPAMAGALFALEHDQDGISSVRLRYRHRLSSLIGILTRHGLELAVEPGAGFFTLWRAPKIAFGRKMEDARDFNLTMAKETGVIGVHFPPYIRYAVVGPVENWVEALDYAFDRAKISY